MLFNVMYTLRPASSGVRWAPLVGTHIQEHHPRTDRRGMLVVEAPNVSALIERMETYGDVMAFAVSPAASA